MIRAMSTGTGTQKLSGAAKRRPLQRLVRLVVYSAFDSINFGNIQVPSRISWRGWYMRTA